MGSYCSHRWCDDGAANVTRRSQWNSVEYRPSTASTWDDGTNAGGVHDPSATLRQAWGAVCSSKFPGDLHIETSSCTCRDRESLPPQTFTSRCSAMQPV